MELSEKNENKQQENETLKVLIADDDPPTRVLLRAAISQWGYEVVEAKDGEEAWEILQAADVPRLLILDWLMPRLDGIDLCRRIKQQLSHRPYIILLTQVAGTANIIKGLEAGADEFLSKPFNMAELRSRLSVGTRIIKYENMLAQQNKQLQDYAMTMDQLAQERAKQLIHNTDLLVMLSMLVLSILQELHEIITWVNEHISRTQQEAVSSEEKEKNRVSLQKISELHISLGYIIDVIKTLQSDTKQKDNKVVSCQINDIIMRVLVACQSLLKNITVKTNFAENLPAISINPELIQQALINITLSIADALRNQSGNSLAIVTSNNIEANKISIVFEDTGLTLSQSELENMLHYFIEPNNNQDKKRLNIAMSKEIFQKYGGDLIVENCSNSGVRIVMELPIIK